MEKTKLNIGDFAWHLVSKESRFYYIQIDGEDYQDGMLLYYFYILDENNQKAYKCRFLDHAENVYTEQEMQEKINSIKIACEVRGRHINISDAIKPKNTQ